MDIVRMILWTSKGGIERRTLTEVEERFFGGNCSLDGMYNQVFENEGALNHFVEKPVYFLLKIELLLTMLSNFERVAALLSFLMGSVFDP